MRKISPLAVAGAILLLSGLGCAPAGRVPVPAPAPSVPPASPTTMFGAEATLAVGGTLSFEDGLTVTLVRVNDSRCPKEVRCVWQGELAPALRLRGGAIGDGGKELTLGTVRARVAASGVYAVSLTDATAASATFVVTKSDAVADADGMLRVASPKPDDAVSSPLEISGEARGSWYFEAQFPVKLLDADGNVIASAPAHAKGDWMTGDFVPFTAALTFDRPKTATGTLVLEKDNPSGLAKNDDSRRVPIRFGTGSAKTGVRGTVTIGPVCPVERIPPDPACAPKPYATTLRVASASGAKVADVAVGADGTFVLALPAGAYVIGPAGGARLPRLAERPFTVTEGAMTVLDLMFDSGIR